LNFSKTRGYIKMPLTKEQFLKQLNSDCYFSTYSSAICTAIAPSATAVTI